MEAGDRRLPDRSGGDETLTLDFSGAVAGAPANMATTSPPAQVA
jgi:hypothetical protein